MKRYNIVTRKTYEKDGEEKVQWLRVGTLAQFPKTAEKEESFILELSMFPHTKFFVFEQKKKEEKAAGEKPEVETDEVAEEEIPF
jgi:hypothetical protein